MREIITATEQISVDESGIILCTVLKDALLTLTDAKENIEAVAVLAEGRRVPVLVDIRASKGATKDARAYLASEAVGKVQSACAMLVDSHLSQLIGNFFLGLNKTQFPIRLFKSKTDAMTWLHPFL